MTKKLKYREKIKDEIIKVLKVFRKINIYKIFKKWGR